MCDGLEVRFWKDSWIPGCTALIRYEDVQEPPLEADAKVIQYKTLARDWDYQRFANIIPNKICVRIRSVVAP